MPSGSAGPWISRTFESETVLMEHWGPDCKLMSRATGKRIQLNDGRWIERPMAVRSEKYPSGSAGPRPPGHPARACPQ